MRHSNDFLFGSLIRPSMSPALSLADFRGRRASSCRGRKSRLSFRVYLQQGIFMKQAIVCAALALTLPSAWAALRLPRLRGLSEGLTASVDAYTSAIPIWACNRLARVLDCGPNE